MSSFAQGHALVVGVGGDDLPHTVDDARGIAAILQIRLLAGRDSPAKSVTGGRKIILTVRHAALGTATCCPAV